MSRLIPQKSLQRHIPFKIESGNLAPVCSAIFLTLHMKLAYMRLNCGNGKVRLR